MSMRNADPEKVMRNNGIEVVGYFANGLETDKLELQDLCAVELLLHCSNSGSNLMCLLHSFEVGTIDPPAKSKLTFH